MKTLQASVLFVVLSLFAACGPIVEIASGDLVEHGPTADVFEKPTNDDTRAYVAGAFG